MVKRRREPDSDRTTTAMEEYSTVFVDTSLDTHLGMLVSNSDTVSDFKRKMVLEHMHCFPKFGEIHIRSLKVKRKANFYHLPDVMLVWSAFQGVKGSWFLSADAFSTPTDHLHQNSLELGTTDGAKIDVRNVDDNNGRGFSSDVNTVQILPMSLHDGVTEEILTSEIFPGSKVEKSLEKNPEFQCNNYSEENCMETESRAKKKRKMRHTEDVCHNPSLEDGFPLFHPSGSDTSVPKIVVHTNPMVDAMKEAAGGMNLDQQEGKSTTLTATDEVSGMRSDQCHIEDGVELKGTSAPAAAEDNNLGSIVNFQNLLSSERRKEDTLLEGIVPENLMALLEHELGQDVAIADLGGVSVSVPDSIGAMEGANSDGNKMAKKKSRKTAKKIQDTTNIEHTANDDDSIKSCTEIHKSDEKEEEKGPALNRDHEVIILSNSKPSDHAHPDLVPKEAVFSSHFCDANGIEEPEIAGYIKKKKKKRKGKKSTDTNIEKSGTEPSDNGNIGSSGLLCPPTDHSPEETFKEESFSYHKEKDVHMTLLNSSTQDASEKVRAADGNDGDLFIVTQTKQTLNELDTRNKNMEEKIQPSTVNWDADFSAVEKDNKIVEFNEVEKDIKNSESKNEKAKNKRKKKKLTASDVEQNLPVRDQKVGIEALPTGENSISFLNSEQEGRHVASLQVLSHKSEEKLKKTHETPGITDDPPRTSETEGGGVSFKQYFLPAGSYKDKAGSGATKPNEEIKTSKRVKENGLPSVGISTELQNSLDSFKIQESEKKAHATKDGGRRQGDSAQNSACDEVIRKCSRRSSKASKNGVKDSGPSETPKTTLKKSKEIRAAFSCLKDKDPSLDKSSSKKEMLPEKRGNKWSQSGLNVNNKMVTKTPKKKTLLTKPGAIFQDNSCESSGDDNGTVHLNGSIGSPSDSSSMSDYSVGKSDLSNDSTRNGSNDGKGKPAGGKDATKLDLSASKNMTMDMILRSSKRFKKAKLLASQNEVESLPVEFVPDSQPINP